MSEYLYIQILYKNRKKREKVLLITYVVSMLVLGILLFLMETGKIVLLLPQQIVNIYIVMFFLSLLLALHAYFPVISSLKLEHQVKKAIAGLDITNERQEFWEYYATWQIKYYFLEEFHNSFDEWKKSEFQTFGGNYERLKKIFKDIDERFDAGEDRMLKDDIFLNTAIYRNYTERMKL